MTVPREPSDAAARPVLAMLGGSDAGACADGVCVPPRGDAGAACAPDRPRPHLR